MTEEQLKKGKGLLQKIESLKEKIEQIDFVEFDVKAAGFALITDDYQSNKIEIDYEELKPIFDRRRITLKDQLKQAEKDFEEL